VCRLDTIGRTTPRAVLVEVKAPEVVGEHKLLARVAAQQRDSAPQDNVTEFAVNIGPVGR